jgi:hypothetical protein
LYLEIREIIKITDKNLEVKINKNGYQNKVLDWLYEMTDSAINEINKYINNFNINKIKLINYNFSIFIVFSLS